MAELHYVFHGQPELIETAGAVAVSLAGEESWRVAGEPMVPVRTSRILLPPGRRIASVQAVPTGRQALADGVELLAAPQPVPLVAGGGDVQPPSSPQVVRASFPGGQSVRVEEELLAGYRLARLEVFPVSYEAQTGTLEYFSEIDVTLELAPADPAFGNVRPRGSRADVQRVLALVDNDSALAAYGPELRAGAAGGEAGQNALPADGPYEYVVVTSEALAGQFEPLVEHKLARGLSATLVTTEYIYANYSSPFPGEDDDAGKVRQFITEAYSQWNTRWVLLGGDIDQVPHRMVRVSANGETATFASDMYFACLDGPYNGDEDDTWAEKTDGTGGGDVDRAPEVFVGRAAVSTAAEAANFVAKTIQYDSTDHPNWETMVWIGENLNDDPLTWGGDVMDAIIDAVIPEYFTHVKCYDREGTCSNASVKAALNDSPNMVNHLGHGNYYINAELVRDDVDALTNAAPYFMYSEACLSGQFERSDAIAEHHVKAPHGAWAVIMNTHYGWYVPGGAGGSYHWHREFYDAVFNEGISRVGEAHFDSKMDRYSSTGTGRWVFFSCTLFGDPEQRLYLLQPGGPRVVEHDPTGSGSEPRSLLRVTFNERMDQASFSVADDVAAFTGPGDTDLTDQITGFAWSDNQNLEIYFHTQSGFGQYALTLGPGILDAEGDPMDQDGDGQLAFAIYGAGEARTIYQADMDEDPGWSLDPGSGYFRWQYGQPAGLGGDPSSGHTGSNVIGYNLNGQYDNNMASAEDAVTPAIDCTGYSDVTLEFWRWLGVENHTWDHAAVEVSNDATNWTTVWANGSATIEDSAWTPQQFDISAVADDEPAVWIRWRMGPTDTGLTFCGWNIDDVVVTGSRRLPSVFTHSPRGDLAGSVDHVDVTFAGPIDPTTFTTGQVGIVGPGGAVPVEAVSYVSGSTYRVSFAARSELGTYTVSVGPDIADDAGGQLDQDGDGVGGEAGDDVYVGTFRLVPPDNDAPAVQSHEPAGQLIDPPTSLRFVFDEPMDTTSFSLADVVAFTGPGGDLVDSLRGYQWLDETTLEVRFAPHSQTGLYSMTIGPEIADDAPGGNAMDQDGDGIAGESTDDRYTAYYRTGCTDLMSTAFQVTPRNLQSAGGTVSVDFTIANSEQAGSGPFRVRFYLSDDGVIDPSTDMPLSLAGGADYYLCQSVPAAGSVSDTVLLLVPAADPFGTDNDYRLGMVVDADGQIQETDEDNNSNRGVGLDSDEVLYGRILGTLWDDLDTDGAADAGEPPLVGWQVYLDADGDGQSDPGETAVTSRSDGTFAFGSLPDGQYILRRVLPAGWLNSHPPAGAYQVQLGPGDVVGGRDFGAYRAGSISGVAFQDDDFDGQWGAGEAGLVGRTVYIDA
ncbi:MAG: hypothetical protein B1H04_06700, partial [Planctomycetales bacterium 4484_123]